MKTASADFKHPAATAYVPLRGALLALCMLIAQLTLTAQNVGRTPTKGGVGTQHGSQAKEVKVEDLDLELVHRGSTLQSFRLHPYLFTPVSFAADTAAFNYYQVCMPEGNALAMANDGRIVGARLPQTFFDRPLEWNPFIYAEAFRPILYNRNQLLYYNTRSPYSKLTYLRQGPIDQREEVCDMSMAININKNINVGGDFSYMLTRGFYIASQSKAVNYRLFGSFTIPQYELYFSGGNNYLRINENGGILKDDYITHPEQYSGGRQPISAIEIPVTFANNVGNSLFLGFVDLTNRYNLGSTKRFLLGDYLPNGTRTNVDTTLFVPIASLTHRIEYRHNTRLFVGNNSELATFYGNTYANIHPRGDKPDSLMVMPFDSTRLTQLNNTLLLSLHEGFRPWVKFGLAAYLRTENRAYYVPDSIADHTRHKEFTTYIGGNITRRNGQLLNFDINGEVALLGRDAGNIRIDGNLQSAFKLALPLQVRAEAHFRNLRPAYLLEHHHGTYLRWDKQFAYMQSMMLGGSLNLPTLGTTLWLRSSTLNNYIYFAEDHTPHQHNKPIQIVEARVRHNYNWGIWHWNAEASYQLSSAQHVLPLPTLSVYGSTYLLFHAAKVLYTQAGVECYYHTNYKAPYYDVASQQFILQQNANVGNFPLINLFANFKLRRVRFFLCYYNVGDLIITPSRRFSLAHYPINPTGLRMGISFDFNN